MADLLNTLGAKKDSKESSDESKISVEVNRGDDIIKKAEAAVEEAAPAKEEKKAEEKVETKASDSDESKKGSEDWTTESMMKEIKKLRQENKQNRLKYGEKLENFSKKAEEEVSAKQKELEELAQYKKELEALKEKEADKKRTLEEKLEIRESAIHGLKTEIESQRSEYEDKLSKFQVELEKYRADVEAQNELAKQKVTNFLAEVPEKYRPYADLIRKGAGSDRDALIELKEAKLNGFFEDKKTVVNHGVPGATTGARATKEKLDNAAQAGRQSKSSQDKIRSALRKMTEGEQNSAFRTNK